MLVLFYGRTGVTGGINSRTKAACACSMCVMGVDRLFSFHIFFLREGGGEGWVLISSIFDQSIPFLFFFVSFTFFLGGGLILAEILKEALNPKQQTY